MIAFNFRRALGGAVMLGVILTGAQQAGAQTPAARFVDSARVEMDRALRDMDAERIDRTHCHARSRARRVSRRSLPVALSRVRTLLEGDWRIHGRKEGAGDSIRKGRAREPGQVGGTTAMGRNHSARSVHERLPHCHRSGQRTTLGPLTGRLSAEATKLAPDNPRVLLLQAYLAEATPPSMGGGKMRAKELASRAVAAFANDHPGPLEPAWGRDEATDMVRRLARANGLGMP